MSKKMKMKMKDVRAQAFTRRANMADSEVLAPPPAGVFLQRPVKATTFRRLYDRRDLPVSLKHDGKGGIMWQVDVDSLDYQRYLPRFFEGLCETEHPYETLARQGVHELLDRGGDRILPVVPQLIVPIRNALNTRVPRVMCSTMRALQHLVTSSEQVGEALVPYFRQILPMFRLFKDQHGTLGAGPGPQDVSDLVEETLQVLERHGGTDAFINIKYMIPTYQSCTSN